MFSDNVQRILSNKYFSGIEQVKRPFSLFGYVYNGKDYGGGWDGVVGRNICGYSYVHANNIYIGRIKAHFHCGHNLAHDIQLQLALRAINGLNINTLSEDEKEHAAKAIECGYLYREDNTLYTKILVSKYEGEDFGGSLFEISGKLANGYFESEAETVAKEIAELIKRSSRTSAQ